MITYCLIKLAIEDSYDYEDLITYFLFMLFTIPIDLLFVILQPLFYILVRKWESDN